MKKLLLALLFVVGCSASAQSPDRVVKFVFLGSSGDHEISLKTSDFTEKDGAVEMRNKKQRLTYHGPYLKVEDILESV